MNILNILTSTKLLKNLYAVVFIGLVLTIYEYVLFFFIAVPEIKKSVTRNLESADTFNNTNIDTITYNNYNYYNTILLLLLKGSEYEPLLKGDDNNIIVDLHHSYNLREQELIKKINSSTVFAAIIMLSFLILLLFLIRNIIKNRGDSIDKSVIMTIIITLVLLFMCQGLFYKYSTSYLDPGNIKVLRPVYGASRNRPEVAAEIVTKVYDKLLE